MPVVTGLEVYQRDRERVKLFLDDEFVLDLPLMEAARLRRGQCLTEAEVLELTSARDLQQAFDRAVGFLSYRPRSVEEVRRHLVKKAVPDSLIAVVMARLQERGYVNDLEFARFWIANRERFKPMGSRALKYELRQKGVDDDVLDVAMAGVDESESAYRAAEARLSRYSGLARGAFRHKLSAMLRRRGFSEYAINDVTLRIQEELEERDPGYFHRDDAE
ncbi:MAG: RecX family transcriptional regulator [Chloroflexota bacterium]|nr:RecX family transcriptional regulator [Chloroflexota bacterium]MDE2945878.1 RecX family transcriptional regulator [Chloroflexota bacterium]